MMKLNVGLHRKVGEANYGSRGASVNLELELDSSLVGDPARLKERIRQLFGLVRTAVAEELNGSNGKPADHGPVHGNGSSPHPINSPSNGNGAGENGEQDRAKAPRPATAAQVKAIHAIARGKRINIVQFLRERFHVGRPDELSLNNASLAIDELKNPDEGQRS
jgi:hypothetical protein